MPQKDNIRIDKFLWAVRIFKTRSLASEACKKGRIIINNIQVKPSRIVTMNEIVLVKKLPVVFTYEVIEPVGNRVSAKLVADYIRDLTSEDEKLKLVAGNPAGIVYRTKGSGRPTKKERRTIDRMNDDFFDK
jgi:ribosome-associated heat shock protein Hsp15